MAFIIEPGQVSLSQIRQQLATPSTLQLTKKTYSDIEKSRASVEHLCGLEQSTYGVNTGFGKLAQTRVDNSQLEQLQRNLVLSHCCGVGEPLSDDVVSTILLLKIMSLSRGYSGVTCQTVDALIALYNSGVLPLIPSKGSVGASGDLAPLAHMSAALMGVGSMRHNGQVITAEEGLAVAGFEPIVLQAKEGLALINGTQASTALALTALFAIEKLFSSALAIGALSVDAMCGSDTPFDSRIHQIRGHQTQISVAHVIRELLKGSEIRRSHVHCDRVQDPYSLRCQPQVMGAVLNSIQHAADVLHVEANGVTDNPLIFRDDVQADHEAQHEALSGGNFHAEPVALVADALAVAVAEIGALSERRTANLVDASQSGLPAFLVDEPGLNSGFMIAQVTAAALASENKALAHPASVDSIPTSANQEDHVSMATFAARRLHDMVDNTAGVLAVELLAAAQGVEFHSLTTSLPLANIIKYVRGSVERYTSDRYFAPDLESAKNMVFSSQLTNHAHHLMPSHAE